MIKVLKEYEAENLLEKEGFSVVKRGLAKNIKEAKEIASEIGYPVVLKDTELLHKTEKSGVKVKIYEEDMEKNFNDLNSKKVLVQKYVEGVEFLIGIKKDPVFDHVILFGLGGIYTELLNDVAMRIYPAKKEDIEKMLDEIKHKKIFNFRNNKIKKEEIVEILFKLNKLIKKHPNIKELDINPLIANKKEILVADSRMVLE